MKKFLYFLILSVCMCFNPSFAVETEIQNTMISDVIMQKHINNIGLRILNANKIDNRIVFLYKRNQEAIKTEPELRKRQVVAYKDFIQYTENDDEIAALLSTEICKAKESYIGPWKGLVSSVQIKFAPKKYELLFDKRSVDYLVKAGYNPIALITFMNKAYIQKRFDKISTHNLTSKRLANVYEYIYYQYPQFLVNNKYLYTESYQNFLLTSEKNRLKLQEKVRKGSKGKIKYE